jgi:sec-independent protein translocase protein TatB
MFGIGWTELVVIVVALIVLGPKELPKAMRSAGAMLRTLNRVTAEYRHQFEQALRDAEKELELEETRKSADAATRETPAPAEPEPGNQADSSMPESTTTAPDAKRHPSSKEG